MFYILLSIFCISHVLAELEHPVDLGHKFDSNTLYWTFNKKFNLKYDVRQEKPFWYASKYYAAPEHGGTHLDAPFHFNKAGWKVGDIPLNRLFVEGIVIDMRNRTATNPDFELEVEDLIQWQKIHGKLPQKVAVLVNFGWAWKYSNRTAYFGSSNGSNFHFPGISKDAATWMVKSGKVFGVGVDTASIDPGRSTEFHAHQILSGANIYLMENLALDNVKLPASDFNLVIMPMKISEGTGAPMRIVAYPFNMEEESSKYFLRYRDKICKLDI